MGPSTYGYSMNLEPDGKPIIRAWGDNKPSEEWRFDPFKSFDMKIEEDSVRIIAELSGIEKSEIRLYCTKEWIVILVKVEELENHQSLELPFKVEPQVTKASYKDGVLEVTLTNSTPGLLHVLSLRQDSKGAFVQFKKEYLPLLKLLDIAKLTVAQRKALLALYNELKGVPFQSIPRQLEEAREKRRFRYTLDTKLLRILYPAFDVRLLSDVYEKLLDETIIHTT